jgi:hypothetical protein
MWQANSSKPKSRRTNERRHFDRGAPLHIHRVEAQIQLAMPADYQPAPGEPPKEEPAVHARLLLNDMTQKGVGIYSPIPFLPGQEVVIRLHDPRPFFLRGRIIWCREYNMKAAILSADPFTYRIGIRFVFESLEEERMVISYYELIRREFIHNALAV